MGSSGKKSVIATITAYNQADMTSTPLTASKSATNISAPTSTTSINDVNYCQFCLSLNQTSTQCSALPLQIYATLINMREAYFSSILRHHPWAQQSTYRNRSPPKKAHSRPDTQCSISASTWPIALQPHNLLPNRPIPDGPATQPSMRNQNERIVGG